jgi:hypothetical protein
MEQKLVVHKTDGKIYKGVTQDFDPDREAFHFLPAEGGGIPIRMELSEMKALFWVKDYIGNRQFVARHSFDQIDRPGERSIVTFRDGEEIWGTLTGDSDGKLGFFLIPADPEDNNVRIFVVRSALKDMRAAS